MAKAAQAGAAKAEAERKGTRLPVLLSDADRAAVAFLRERYLFATMINAFRYALREQTSVDGLKKASEGAGRRRALRIRESSVDKLFKSRWQDEAEPGTKQTSLWIGKAEEDRIGAVMAAHGLKRRSEAVRFVLRMQAEAEGFSPPSGNW